MKKALLSLLLVLFTAGIARADYLYSVNVATSFSSGTMPCFFRVIEDKYIPKDSTDGVAFVKGISDAFSDTASSHANIAYSGVNYNRLSAYNSDIETVVISAYVDTSKWYYQFRVNDRLTLNSVDDLPLTKYTNRNTIVLHGDITPQCRGDFLTPEDSALLTRIANGDVTRKYQKVCNTDSTYWAETPRTDLSSTACFAACSGHPGCTASYNVLSKDGTLTCYLLEHCQETSSDSVYTVLDYKPAFWNEDYTLDRGGTCATGQIAFHSGQTFESCVDKCYENYQCQAFDFIWGRDCYLKSNDKCATGQFRGSNTASIAVNLNIASSGRSRAPSAAPTKYPTPQPTNTPQPTPQPTKKPTPQPTNQPTVRPTEGLGTTVYDDLANTEGDLMYHMSRVYMYEGFDETFLPHRIVRTSNNIVVLPRRKQSINYLALFRQTDSTTEPWEFVLDDYAFTTNKDSIYLSGSGAEYVATASGATTASVFTTEATNNEPQVADLISYPGNTGTALSPHQVGAALNATRLIYAGYHQISDSTPVQALLYVLDYNEASEAFEVSQTIQPPYAAGDSTASQEFFGRGLYVSEDGTQLAVCDDHEDRMKVYLYEYSSTSGTYVASSKTLDITLNALNEAATQDCQVEWKGEVVVIASARAMSSSVYEYAAKWGTYSVMYTMMHDTSSDTILPYVGGISSNGDNLAAVGVPGMNRVLVVKRSDDGTEWTKIFRYDGFTNEDGTAAEAIGLGVQMNEAGDFVFGSGGDTTNILYFMDYRTTLAPTMSPTLAPTTAAPTTAVPTPQPTKRPTEVAEAPTSSPVAVNERGISVSQSVFDVSDELVDSGSDDTVTGYTGQSLELDSDSHTDAFVAERIILTDDGLAYLPHQRTTEYLTNVSPNHLNATALTVLTYSSQSWAPSKEWIYKPSGNDPIAYFLNFATSHTAVTDRFMVATSNGANDNIYFTLRDGSASATFTQAYPVSTDDVNYHDLAGEGDYVFVSGPLQVQVFQASETGASLTWIGSIASPVAGADASTSLFGRGMHASSEGEHLAVCDDTEDVGKIFLYTMGDAASWDLTYTLKLPWSSSSSSSSSPTSYSSSSDCRVQWRGDIVVYGSSRKRQVAIYQYNATSDSFVNTQKLSQPSMADFGSAIATNGGSRVAVGYPGEDKVVVYANSASMPDTWSEFDTVSGTAGFGRALAMNTNADLMITAGELPHHVYFYKNGLKDAAKTSYPLISSTTMTTTAPTSSSASTSASSTASTGSVVVIVVVLVLALAGSAYTGYRFYYSKSAPPPPPQPAASTKNKKQKHHRQHKKEEMV